MPKKNLQKKITKKIEKLDKLIDKIVNEINVAKAKQVLPQDIKQRMATFGLIAC